MRGNGWGKKEIDTEQYLNKKNKKKKTKANQQWFLQYQETPLIVRQKV